MDEKDIKFKEIHLLKSKAPKPFSERRQKKYLFLKNLISKSVISYEIWFNSFTCFLTPGFFVSNF